MTRLQPATLTCPACSHEFRVIAHASINIWMNPELAKKLSKGELGRYKCPQCEASVPFARKILVAGYKGDCTISTGESPNEIRQKLVEAGIIDHQGELVKHEPSPRLFPPPPSPAQARERKIRHLQELIRALLADLQEDDSRGQIFEIFFHPRVENIRLQVSAGNVALEGDAMKQWQEILAIATSRRASTGKNTSE